MRPTLVGDRICPGCERRSDADATFCSDCGAPLDTDLPVWPALPVAAEPEPSPGGWRRALTAVAVAAVVVSLVAVLALPGDDRGEGGDGSGERGLPASPADSEPQIAGLIPEARSAPSPPLIVASQDVHGRIDPTVLPDTHASHLVITTGGAVQFIDLTSGERTDRSIGGVDEFNAIFPVDAGVVVTKSGIDRPVYVPVVGDPVDLTDPDSDFRTWPIGVAEDTVFVQGELKIADTWHTTIGAVTLEGARLWQQVNPFGLGAVGVTATGDVITNAGGRMFAISADGTTDIGVGVAHAVIGNIVLVDNCDDNLTCVLQALDRRDNSRTDVSIDRGFIEHRGGSPSFILWSQNDGPKVYSVVGDEVTAIDVVPDRTNGELGLAVDENGVVAVANHRVVTLTDQSGAQVEIAFDRAPCCRSRSAIAFIAIND